MNRILVFEDHPDDCAEIRRLISEVINQNHLQLIVDSDTSIKKFDETNIHKADPIDLIITDVLNTDNELNEYFNYLKKIATPAKESKHKKKLLVQANDVLINAAIENIKIIVKKWEYVGCPLIVITKINHSNLLQILKTVVSDGSLSPHSASSLSEIVEELNFRVKTMYECTDLAFFLKKEFGAKADKTLHDEFGVAFTRKLSEILSPRIA